MLVATEQAQNPISSAKLLRAYNEQGNYSVRQSLRKLFGIFQINNLVQSLVIKALWMATACIIVLNFSILYSWLYHDDSDLGKIPRLFQ